MIYTVAEISEIVGLSKASIYNKLKTKDLKEHLTKKQGVTYLDEIGLDLIKDDIKDFESASKDFTEDIKSLNVKDIYNKVNVETEDFEPLNSDKDYINALKDNINYLKSENERLWDGLAVKDLQIHELNERLKEAHKLTENSQVLLRDKPQDIKALEEHFQDLDIKLINIREHMQERKEQQEHQTKGLFKRLFEK